MNIPYPPNWPGPPDDDEPTCGTCGEEGEELRCDGGDLVCYQCCVEDFYILPTPAEYAQEQNDLEADHRYDELKDRRTE